MGVWHKQHLLSLAHIKGNSHPNTKGHTGLRSLCSPNPFLKWKVWPYGSLKLLVKTVMYNPFDTEMNCIQFTKTASGAQYRLHLAQRLQYVLQHRAVAAMHPLLTWNAAAASPCALSWARSKSLAVTALAAFCCDKLCLQHLASWDPGPL